MELEQNKATLKKAILALPSYAPPEGLWDSIEEQLEEEESSPLGLAIQELPKYSPPAFVWKNISQELDQPQLSEKPKFKLRAAFFSRAAAIALILATTWLGYQFLKNSNTAKVSYAETTITDTDISIDYQEDEPMIQLVSQSFEESPLARQQENYTRLKEELKELNQAKDVILEMMENYGEDPQMIKELADIERSRTDVVMQMAEFI